METMVLERTTPVDAILSFIGAERITIRKDADKITWTPKADAVDDIYIDGPDSRYIDPADYPDTTAYLNALPGVAERLLSYRNLPDSEFEDWD